MATREGPCGLGCVFLLLLRGLLEGPRGFNKTSRAFQKSHNTHRKIRAHRHTSSKTDHCGEQDKFPKQSPAFVLPHGHTSSPHASFCALGAISGVACGFPRNSKICPELHGTRLPPAVFQFPPAGNRKGVANASRRSSRVLSTIGLGQTICF